ncbi:MAG: glycoside hydrolase family 3 N-terminal domain-containing protein [Sandaracinaceae bacterium]
MDRRAWIAWCLLILSACDDGADPGLDAGPFDAGAPHVVLPFEPTDDTAAYCQGDDAAIEARVQALLEALTLEEKVSLMAGASTGLVEGAWLVPGIEEHGIPGLHMLDGPRGVSGFTSLHATTFPVAMLRGATWDPELEREVGAAMARELKASGADVLLAPTINILRHPRWGRAQETYSEDPMHMGEMGVAFVLGVQSEGVLASAKHFAANSIEDTRHDVDVTLDERTLREIYLPHFERVVRDAHVGSVMSAYNRVNGLYCDLNRHLLTDILKEEWGFAGFVESDWLLGTHGDGESVTAGLDIEMPDDFNFRNLRRAILNRELTEDDIDASARRILRAQLCFGLDARERVLDDPTMRETPEHLALARRVARRGIVLLKNEGGALPLDRAAATRLVVLGRNADVESIGDLGSSQVNPTRVITALDGLREAAPGLEILYIAGTPLPVSEESVVSSADAVIVVTGLQASDEGESDIGAGDRESLALAPDEVALIQRAAALNDRVIVVLEGGAAILVEDFEADVEAIVMAFYPGSEGGAALAEILFGDESPTGRLPFVWPRAEADLPPFDNTSGAVTYGYFHGYRHLMREGTASRYAFGHGLGYTTFAISNLVVDPAVTAGQPVELTVDVTNTGTRRGRATVQAYVAAVGSRVERAAEDLRAFAQVELDPDEMQTVTLRFDADDLRFWDETAAAWELEATEYELRVGQSAEAIEVSATLTAP